MTFLFFYNYYYAHVGFESYENIGTTNIKNT